MTDYRKAASIQLYEIGIIISQKGDDNRLPLGTDIVSKSWNCSFAPLVELLKSMGFGFSTWNEPVYREGKVIKHTTMYAENLDFTVYQNDPEQWLNSWAIVGEPLIEAQVISSNLLNIKLTITWEGSNTIQTYEWTYSGRFGIQWDMGEITN